MCVDKKIIDFLKKENDNLKKKLDGEKKLVSWIRYRRKKDVSPIYNIVRGRKKW